MTCTLKTEHCVTPIARVNTPDESLKIETKHGQTGAGLCQSLGASVGCIPKTNNRKRSNNMTKRENQVFCNQVCKEVYENAIAELNSPCTYKRLRTCRALVWETEHYYILQSYRTLIAVIDKSTDTLYDVLRYVYGYTPTSAQHISKFEKDYCRGKWNCEMRLTYRG